MESGDMYWHVMGLTDDAIHIWGLIVINEYWQLQQSMDVPLWQARICHEQVCSAHVQVASIAVLYHTETSSLCVSCNAENELGAEPCFCA